MASNVRSIQPMPMLVIDNCSSEDNDELIKKKVLSSKNASLSRSLSLPNHGEAYKDLSGAVHYSSSNRLKNIFIRSHSYPTNYFSNDKSLSYISSFSNKIHLSMNLLDPNSGIHSPGGSSSRYSLYGSFFDLSESGYHASYSKTDNRLLTSDGCILLTVDKPSKISSNAYQEKCNDWLKHLDTV